MRLPLNLFLTVFLTSIRGEPCMEYGCQNPPHHEPFVPAPPGHTPRCAKPGQTFCESLDHYPQHLIRFLIEKLPFDSNTVLIDESHDDFNSYRSEPEYLHHEGYNYHRPEVHEIIHHPLPFLPPHYTLGRQPAPVHGSPPNNTQQGYNYPAPPRSLNNPFLPQAPTIHPQLSRPQQHHLPRQHQSDPYLNTQVSTLNALGQEHGWWANRYTRGSDRSGPPLVRPDRSQRENPLLEFASSRRNRAKRQANGQATPLCPTNSLFIMPKAALNNKGNWMYVVNLKEQNDRYTQLVRSETCARDTCNGLCSLPSGYTSRCQQQYVQKRLIALEGSGDRLYTDVFWFPHCCTCQVVLSDN